MEIVSNIALISINATLFHQLIAFLIFMFIMNRIMFRPLRGVMNERESFLEKIKLDTVDATSELQRLTDDLKLREAAVRKEAQRARDALEVQGNQEAVDLLESTRKDIESIRKKSEAEVNAKISEVKKDLQKESEALAVSIMEKVLDRRLVA